MDNCLLCGRPMPEGTYNEHHLIPSTFKGKETVTLHRVCHRTLHAVFTEREMQHYYHTIERCLESEEVQRFVKWIAKKDPTFNVKTKDTAQRRKKRKR